MKSLELIANNFVHAFYNKEWPGEEGSPISDLSIHEAYQVQDLAAKKRIEMGERVAGLKVGCASDAIRSQFGLKEPIYE